MAIGENLFYRTRDLLDDLILGLFFSSLLFFFVSFFLSFCYCFISEEWIHLYKLLFLFYESTILIHLLLLVLSSSPH